MIGTNTALRTATDTYPVVPVDSLDELTLQLLDPATTALAFQRIVGDLADLRASRSPMEWRNYTRAFQEHPLAKHLRQDAFTYRAYRKPRGYAGDAVLMDMVYGTGDGELIAKSSELGKRIYAAAESTVIFAATKGRVARLSAGIDEVCEINPNAHILSVACGHLREAARSTAVRSNGFGRFVGLDQDRRSLREIQKNHPNVECIAASIGELMDGSVNPGAFDYIYSAGLYDYLDDQIGRHLLHTLVSFIKPGGCIMIANFLPNLPTLGYMEAAMDWWMVYRSAEQLQALADNLPAAKSSHVVTDPLKHLNYLQIQF